MPQPALPDRIREIAEFDRPLAPLTTWGIGGTAALFLRPRDEEDMRLVTAFLANEGLGCYLLGGGSNVLINDGLIDAPVISTSRMTEISAEERGGEVAISCGAGAELKKLFVLSLKEGWSGLEYTAGIPGSVGGALAGNAGTKEGAIGEVASSVRAAMIGSVREYRRGDVRWAYRSSPFADGALGVITGAVFSLTQDDAEKVRQRAARAAAGRSAQPHGARTAGCVFKNPPGDTAGKLLDASGCKGLSFGGAYVSATHANFFENRGGASASDVLELAAICAGRVRDKFGIELELEIRLIGFEDKERLHPGA